MVCVRSPAWSHGAVSTVTDQRQNPPLRPSTGLQPKPVSLPSGHGDRSRVTLEEVLEAGIQNLRLSLDMAGTGELDFEALDHAVSATRSQLVTSEALATDSDEIDPVAAEREGGEGVVSHEIHCLVALIEAGTTPPSFADDAQSALERASIILHEAHQVLGFDSQRYGRDVDIILRSADSVDLERFARASIADLSATLPHHVFDAWMPAILTTVRRATVSPCDWLAEISVSSDSHAKEALWPFIINELLVGLKNRTQPIDPGVHAIDPLAVEVAIERLSRLPAIQRSLLAPGMFSLRQSFAHELLIRLMDGPARHAVGPLLLAAFHEELPVDPGMSFCVFATRKYDDSIGWLLTEQLKNLDAPVTDEVQRSVAWVLMSALEQLDGERRREIWVPASIDWLGGRDVSLDSDVQRASTHTLMERVASERKGLHKVWTRESRRAAQNALKNGGL